MRRVLAATALLALAAAAPAAAAPQEWIQAHDVVVSPDGRHVYASGARTYSFRIDQATGALERIGHTEPGASNAQIAISPDGRHVYVGRGQNFPTGGLFVMTRHPETGLLTHESTFAGDGRPGSSAIGPIADVELSADGRQLYVSQRNPDLLAVFDRDLETGGLTQRQALYRGPDLHGDFAGDLAVTRDGRHVYMAGGGVVLLRRDPDGLLTSAGMVRDPDGTDHQVAVSDDGRFVYAGSGKVDAWRRDAGSGALEHLSHADRPGTSCWCASGAFISAAPDGRSVFSSSAPDPVIHQARATDAGVSHERTYTNGADGVTGINHPTAMAWTPDGRFAYVTAAEGSRNSTIAAFRRSDDGLAFAGSLGPAFETPSGPPTGYGRAAITINDGALYTNDPNVQVTISNPTGFSSLRLSDTDDFSTAPTQRLVDFEQTYDWRLTSTGPGRSVRRVHVRFTPIDSNVTRLFDDIVLDESPPELLTARLDGARLKLRARDNRSGVKRVQVTTSRKKPGKARRYRKSLPVSRTAKVIHVRIFDGAGNGSRWRKVRRP